MIDERDPRNADLRPLTIRERGLIVAALNERAVEIKNFDGGDTNGLSDELGRLAVVMCTAKAIIQGPIED